MTSTLVQIDRSWPLAPAEQIKARLRVAIRTGELRAGSRLPRIREMAQATGLNPNTIAAAYRGLAREGLIVPRGRGGTIVAPGLRTTSPAEAALVRAVDRLIAVARRTRNPGAEVLRLVAGRWHARIETGPIAPPSRSTAFSPIHATRPAVSVYETIRHHDYDES